MDAARPASRAVADESLQDQSLCPGCRYSLRGLTSNRCPECGRKFDPCDASTMRRGTWVARLCSWLLRPDGTVIVALSVIAASWSICAIAYPLIAPRAIHI